VARRTRRRLPPWHVALGTMLVGLSLGAAAAVLGLSDAPDNTLVAGRVVERPDTTQPSEPPETVDEATRPARGVAGDAALDSDPPREPTEAHAHVPPAADPAEHPDDTEGPPSGGGRPAPPRAPREPEQAVEPEGDPTPPSPADPGDGRRFALLAGEGLSLDTAEPATVADGGGWAWQIRSLAADVTQDAAVQRSRAAMARVEVRFDEATRSSQEQVRDFRCNVRVTAGSRRLVTDAAHVFNVSFWTTDGYALLDQVGAARVPLVVDLGAGDVTTFSSDVYEDFDAADGVSYTCRVEYQEL